MVVREKEFSKIFVLSIDLYDWLISYKRGGRMLYILTFSTFVVTVFAQTPISLQSSLFFKSFSCVCVRKKDRYES